MTVAKGSDAQLFDHGGFKLKPAAVPSRGSSELAVWTIEVAPGEKSPPHSVNREEVFFVMEGELSITISDENFRAGPGDAIIAKPDTLFHLSNQTQETVRAVCMTSAGMEATVNGERFTPPWSR